jgi:hypothetical protein
MQKKGIKHSPIEVKDGAFTIKISENGIVTLVKDMPNDEFDDMTIPARVCIKVATLLKETRQDDAYPSEAPPRRPALKE